MSGRVLELSICFVMLAGICGFLIQKNRKPPQEYSELLWNLKGFYAFACPGIYVILQYIPLKKWLPVSGERLENMKKLYVSESRENIAMRYYCRLGSLLAGILIGTLSLCILLVISEPVGGMIRQNYFLEREEPGGENQVVELQAMADGMSRDIQIEVEAREYTPEEVKARIEDARQYIMNHYLNGNADAEHIQKPLQLIKRIPDSQITVQWEIEDNDVIGEDGSLNNQNLEEPVQTDITAVLQYQKTREEVILEITILPCKKSSETKFWEKWELERQKLDSVSKSKNVYPLPAEVDGRKISYKESKSRTEGILVLMAVILVMLLPSLIDYFYAVQLKKRQEELQREYPDWVDRFALLVGAGLTIRGAWIRITDDYLMRCRQDNGKKQYLYEEMLVTRRDLENGVSEAKAYEAFGRRISLLSYIKFSALLVQNLRRGSQDILKRMERESRNAIQERREAAKVMGEEAGTKLLFPMMLMLVIVFAMILAAAFYQL